MNIFDKEIKLFNDIEKGIDDVIKTTVKRFDFVLLDYNKNKQLKQKGEDSKGVDLGSYSNFYRSIRISKGLQTKHVDLNFSGRLHANLRIEVKENEFVINSDIEYSNKLEKQYGKNIFGIQEQYLKEFVNIYLLPAIKKYINDKLTRA